MSEQDYGTIRIPRSDFERHNDRRKEMGMTWVQYLDGVAPQHDTPNADEVAAAIEASMDAPSGDGDADALATIEERTGRIERMMEDLQR